MSIFIRMPNDFYNTFDEKRIKAIKLVMFNNNTHLVAVEFSLIVLIKNAHYSEQMQEKHWLLHISSSLLKLIFRCAEPHS